MNTYIIERKPKENQYDDVSMHSQFWNGNYEEASQIAESISTDKEYYYSISEIDELGFVNKEWEV